MMTNLLGQEIQEGEGVAVGTLEQYIVAIEEHFEEKGEVSDAYGLFAGAINAIDSAQNLSKRGYLPGISDYMIKEDDDRKNSNKRCVFSDLALQIVDDLTSDGRCSTESIANLNLDVLVVAMRVFSRFAHEEGYLDGFEPRDVSAFVSLFVNFLREQPKETSYLDDDGLYFFATAFERMMKPSLGGYFYFQDSALADYLTFFLPTRACDLFRIGGPDFAFKVASNPGILNSYPRVGEVLRDFYIRDTEIDREKKWYNLSEYEKSVLGLLWPDEKTRPEAIERRLKRPTREE